MCFSCLLKDILLSIEVLLLLLKLLKCNGERGESWQEKSGHLVSEHAGMLTSGYHAPGHCVKGKTAFLLPQRERSGEGGGRYYLHSEVKTCSVGTVSG